MRSMEKDRHIYKIGFEDLEVAAYVGITESEISKAQPIILSLKLECILPVSLEDDINNTVDYFEIAERIKAIVSGGRFQLIETLANVILDDVLANPRVRNAQIKICKPQAIVNAKYAWVEVEKTK